MAAHALIERYHARDSAIHHADARVKLVAALAYIFAITFTREGDWTALALLALPVGAVVVTSKLPLRLVFGRALLAVPFLLVALPLLFTRPGEAIAELPVLGWTISDEGTTAVVTILGKSWLSVIVGVVLMATTEAPTLLRALRALRLPRLLVASIEFAYRYLFVVTDEASRMLQARASRSAALPGHRAGGRLAWRARIAGNLVGTLFVRSIERSERVHAAMLARGYDGEPRHLAVPPIGRLAVAVAAVMVAYGAAVQAAVRL